MDDEQNIQVEQEEVQEQLEAQSQQEANSQAESRRRNDVEYNWAEARRKMSELERKNYEMEAQLKRLTPQAPPEEDEFATLSEEDIITVKQAKKLAEKTANQVAQKVLREREAATAEERIMLKFPDYKDVITNENVEYLKQNEPEITDYLLSLAHDPYKQASEAYKWMKKVVKPLDPQLENDKKRAQANAAKPLSVQAISKSASPIGQAHMFENGLTPQLKKQLWDEMQAARKAG